jgi:integrase
MTDILIHQTLDQYYFEHVRPTAVDVRSIENSIKHLKGFFENLPLKDVGIPDCRAYILARTRGEVGRPCAIPTASKELGTLRAATQHAFKWKRITLADMPMFEQPAYVPNANVWLLKPELQQLLDAAAQLKREIIPKRTWAFIQLCYYTASRRAAIETLTWDQVDLLRERISLAKEGEKKTKKRRPTIAIDPALLPVLHHLKQHQVNEFVLGSNKRMDQWFDRAAKAAGLMMLRRKEGRGAARLTPHVLRHSRATHLLDAGKSAWAVANLLGDTIATVDRIYAHHCPTHTETLFERKMPTFEDIAS